MSDYHRSFDLGNIEFGGWVPVRSWLNLLSRYKSVRFFGFVRGRCFVGVMWGSKGQSKLDQYSEEICKISDENQKLREEIQELSDEMKVRGEMG